MKSVLNYVTTKVNNNLFEKILYGFFVAFLVIEPLVKLIPTSNDYRIKAILKFCLLLLVSIYALKIKSKTLLTSLILLIGFFLGQIFLNKKHSVFHFEIFKEITQGDIYIVVKYLFVIIFIAAYESLNFNEGFTKKLVKLLLFFLIINTFFIAIGVIADLELLRSYPYSERFGVIGLIQLHGEAIYLYIIGIFLAYIEYINNKKSILLFWLIFGGIMLGKKGIFIFLLLLLLIHLYYRDHRKTLYLVIFLLSGSILFFKKIILLFIEIFPFWEPLYNKFGVVTVVFSKRNLMFENCLEYIDKNWSMVNYLFGGIDFSTFRSELGFFDLFLTFGFVGLVVYLLFLNKYFFSGQTVLVKLILLAVFITEAFSGGLLINILPVLFLFVIMQYLKENLGGD